MFSELLSKIEKLRFYSTKPNSLRVHVGAHKTATTHLQDTLEICERKLRSQGLDFLTRDYFRNRIAFLNQDKIFLPTKKNSFEKHYTITSKLFRSCGSGRQLVLSDENILGNVMDALSINPYQNPKTNFINYAANFTDVNVFYSIRSFSAVYPGAYITGLRFDPQKALRMRRELLRKLQKGDLPSWVEIINRIQDGLPNCKFKCWTFESYLENQEYVVANFLNQTPPQLPKLPKTIKTATPTIKAIQEIESIIEDKNFTLSACWRKKCDRIFRKYAITEINPKFTFIPNNIKNDLDAQYNEDIEKLKSMKVLL